MTHLETKLKFEAEGILSWLLAGAKRLAEDAGQTKPPTEISTEEDPGCRDNS